MEKPFVGNWSYWGLRGNAPGDPGNARPGINPGPSRFTLIISDEAEVMEHYKACSQPDSREILGEVHDDSGAILYRFDRVAMVLAQLVADGAPRDEWYEAEVGRAALVQPGINKEPFVADLFDGKWSYWGMRGSMDWDRGDVRPGVGPGFSRFRIITGDETYVMEHYEINSTLETQEIMGEVRDPSGVVLYQFDGVALVLEQLAAEGAPRDEWYEAAVGRAALVR